MSTPTDTEAAQILVNGYQKLKTELSKRIVGQDDVIEQVFIAMAAGGHALLEGVPGLAKTLLVKSFADAMHLGFRRIQFTPDLMPADITGTEIIQEDADTGRRKLIFMRGPIFSQIILADEINRTPPKTQAALLEAMQEHSVTVGQETFALPRPFFCSGHAEPHRAGRHVPAPRGPEGSFPLPHQGRLPHPG
nr:AAA family ATPase [Verrucomicrobium spinosum]